MLKKCPTLSRSHSYSYELLWENMVTIMIWICIFLHLLLASNPNQEVSAKLKVYVLGVLVYPNVVYCCLRLVMWMNIVFVMYVSLVDAKHHSWYPKSNSRLRRPSKLKFQPSGRLKRSALFTAWLYFWLIWLQKCLQTSLHL